MNIFIAGANGGTGRHLVNLALEYGHKVTALVRDPDKLKTKHPCLKVVKGDVMQTKTFSVYIQGQDIVISAIGVTGGGFFNDRPTTLYSKGTENLLTVMASYGVHRFFCISASAVEISPELPGFIRFITKNIVQRFLKNMYADIRRMEHIVKESNAVYSIMRPPQLTDGPLIGRFRTAVNIYLKDCLKISRADLAMSIIQNLCNTEFRQAIVEVAY